MKLKRNNSPPIGAKLILDKTACNVNATVIINNVSTNPLLSVLVVIINVLNQ